MAYSYDFTFQQGTGLTFDVQLWTDTAKTVKRDLTGYEVKSQVRKSYASSTALWDKTSVANTSSLSFPDGKANGKIRFTWTPAETRTFPPTQLRWDAEVYQVADVTKDERVIEGSPNCTPEVTR